MNLFILVDLFTVLCVLKARKQYVSKRKKFAKKPFDFNVTTVSSTLHHKESGSEKKLYFQRNDFIAVRNEDGMWVVSSYVLQYFS